MSQLTATIRIDRLTVFARHGVAPQERAVGNRFEVWVGIEYPAVGAMAFDRLDATVNYADVVRIVKEQMSTASDLIEHAAGRILEALRAEYPLMTAAEVTVSKPSPPIPGVQLAAASVTLRYRK